MEKQLEAKTKQLEELVVIMSDPAVLNDRVQYTKHAANHAYLADVCTKFSEFKEVRNSLAEAEEIIAANEDEEFVALAQEEKAEHSARLEALEDELFLLALPPDPDDSRNTIFEIRAGTGGDEAALFVADLFRMYSRYCESAGWKIDVMNSNPTEMGGFKEIIFLVTGKNVYRQLKFESGGHRVQRVPVTETSGRIHTSAVTVAVLPEADEVEVQIDRSDLQIDVYRSSGPGGQSVNTTDSAVRITHNPSGLVVICQDEKSQLKNKNKALKVLQARLLEQAKAEQHAEISETRKGQVGSGDRSQRIRTYNFPQNRLTDHRIGLTLYKLEAIMQGQLDMVIGPLAEVDVKERMANA
ncbi:peptide chain release factor 1 [Candidatus Hydrogenedentota bacterium]